MTGPSFPFFQPNVTPSFTFQNPGDAGAVGMELHGLAKAFGEMQEREQLAQQQAAEHEMAMQGLAVRHIQEQQALERAKVDVIQARTEQQKQKAIADKEAAERELKATEAATKKATGAAQKDAAVGRMVENVGNAGVGAEEMPQDYLSVLQGLLGSMLTGGEGPGTGVPDEAVTAELIKSLAPQPPSDGMPWAVGNDVLYNRQTGEIGKPIGIQGKQGQGTGSGPGTGGNARLMATEANEMMASYKSAKQLQQNLGAIVGASRAASKVKTGEFAPYFQSFGKVMVATGLATEAQLKEVEDREAFMQLSVRNSLALLASGAYGTGNSITEQDRRAAEKLSGADLKLEPRTIRLTMRTNILSQAQQLEQYKAQLDALKANPPKGYTAADVEARYGAGVGGSAGLQKTIDMLRAEANQIMSHEEVTAIANSPKVSAGENIRARRAVK